MVMVQLMVEASTFSFWLINVRRTPLYMECKDLRVLMSVKPYGIFLLMLAVSHRRFNATLILD